MYDCFELVTDNKHNQGVEINVAHSLTQIRIVQKKKTQIGLNKNGEHY